MVFEGSNKLLNLLLVLNGLLGVHLLLDLLVGVLKPVNLSYCTTLLNRFGVVITPESPSDAGWTPWCAPSSGSPCRSPQTSQHELSYCIAYV